MCRARVWSYRLFSKYTYSIKILPTPGQILCKTECIKTEDARIASYMGFTLKEMFKEED